uniref:Protein kinase domain-containing protein n=2 Tax=Kalanchoe fedtschenkoi TaxID=63787 RepID=A0A7N0UNZ4_KALFE
MNQYHIYEAIGRGKHSTVYKGRKKKTIEYFAIKSVDKSQKSKVLQEVRILHALDHPNVLHFYSWYETSAHLWLVLEYCVGGDLMTLLRQDNQLPEESIHTLAYDLVKALQFLHSKGIIYCDLKPSNILLDENGHTKLCDFGLARKLVDISKTPSSTLPQAKRGTPCYMAPELFEDGGVHSYASDFWALGCVLFECYTGRPPFVGKEFTQLVKSVLSDPTPPLPGSPSRPFANLINSLLIKDPAERLHWVELCDHAFWTTKFTLIPLPPQPAFTNMIESNSKPCLSERNDSKPLHNRTPPKSREKDTRGTLRHDENSGLKGYSTPVKGTPVSRKFQTKTSGRVVEEKQREPSSATKAVNLLRLSRIAKSNLQRENEKENYRRPLANDCENDSEVKLENTDMELDFNENAEDDTQEDMDGADIQSSPLEVKLHGQTQFIETTDEDANLNDTGPSTTVDILTTEDSKPVKSATENTDVAVTPTASPQIKNPRATEATGPTAGFDSSKASNFLGQSLWHPSDLSVRPVMPSRKADKVSDSAPSLPFETVSPSDFVKIPKEQINAMNIKIISILQGNTNIVDKQNVIRYLEILSTNGDAANILTNGPIMLLLVKLLRQSKVSALRIQLASLIGLLVRHSTFIEDDLAHSGIIGSLTDGLRDRQEKVRRFSMAALGELLFYISTQDEQAKDNNPPESPSKDSRSTGGWQVSNALISLVTSVLRKGEDDLTQLYALRTIENICSQGVYWATRFSSQDVISNLCYIYKAVGKQENMRLTAGSCLVRLARFNPPIIQSVFEKLSFKDIAPCIAKGSSREQQISINLMNMALLESHLFTNIGRCLLPLVEDKNILPGLLSLIEQGSEVLRGKALVFISLLCKNGRRWLQQLFCNARLLSAVDRLTKEKDSYVQQCLEAFVHVVASTVPGLLEIIIGDIQQMISGRRHGMSAGFARSTSKSNVQLFPVVLHLLRSSCFKHRVVTQEVLQQLTGIIKLAESSFQGRDDFQLTLLQIFESITEDPSAIQLNPEIYIHNLLPSLTVLYKGNKDGNARFLCLKIVFDVMVNLLDEPLEAGQRSEDLKSIATHNFLPLYPTLVDDDDPIPMYAQKLLVMLIECDFISISDILHKKTVSQSFEFLLGDLSNANVNNVKLCLALTSAPEMENKVLSQLKVVRRIGNLLEFVKAKDMEDFLEPTLQLCMAFLLRSVSNRKGFVYSKEPTLLSEGSCNKLNSAVDEQQCISDIHDFSSNVGVLLELSGSEDANIADLASECVVLLLAAAPREATTSFLFNLPKVTPILESSSQDSVGLPLLRVLHALGYSCRQYLSHAMILSLSVAEISRIEAIVHELRSSGMPDVASAALVVALELQRMPRYI